jgi:protein-S-isoprenylcysteine O-methyltransferase Ste14
MEGDALLLLLFKALSFLITIIFVVFISDFRKKEGMIPLVNEKTTKLLKFSYLIPLLLFVYTLVTMNHIMFLDYFALLFTFLGTVLAVKAKTDLGICHTWTGYCKKSSKLTANGIYAYIRHPLYTGIFLFIFGGLMTIIPHAQWYITLIVVGMIVFIMSFLSITASKETQYLEKALGKDFQRYKEQTHPFLPLRKFIN